MCSVRSNLFRYYTGDRSPIQLLITQIPFAVKLMFSQHPLSPCRCVYNRNRQLYVTWNALCHRPCTNRYSPCRNFTIALSNNISHYRITNAESVGNSVSDWMKIRNGWKTQSASNCYDYTLITNLMHWLLFIHKILLSSTCFEHQVLIFRRT